MIISIYAIYWLIAAGGITMGYHRYFAHNHNKFKLPALLEVQLLYLGLLCGGQSALSWSGVHRMHHAYTDTEKDPHSPKYNKWWQIIFSTWRVKNIPRKFVKDLLSNPRVMFFHRYGLVILAVTYAVAFAIDYIIVIHLVGVFVLSYISFGLLNLLGHDDNGPVNRWWLNIIAPMEGNHKDHHNER